MKCFINFSKCADDNMSAHRNQIHACMIPFLLLKKRLKKKKVKGIKLVFFLFFLNKSDCMALNQ